MEDQNIIYGLFCPFTDEIYYVGKSSVGLSRPSQHMVQSHSEKINVWVNGLKALGHAPHIRILETVTSADELRDKEQFWIYKYVAEGKNLLNISSVTASRVLSETRANSILSDTETPQTSKDAIAGFVKLRRKEANLTQPMLADKAGVGLRFVRELEQGKRTLRLDRVEQVLKHFGATLIPHQTSGFH